ncbi:CD225/dispanin family protein [uncultured Xanthomonas sp.]|uniref:CD225/dispanin family protein n=1 Tax=uncultured Xanthomonas sp. TaxID=152831 RepID=UPI003749FCE1
MNQPEPPAAPNVGVYVPNNMVWAILSTLFCCLPLGIVSIVYAAQVDGRRAAGDIEGARAAARKAGWWALASPILVVVWIFVAILLEAIGSLAGN